MPGFSLIKAARYLRVAPWELLEQPVVWRNLALSLESGHDWAEVELMKRSQKR